MKGLKQAMKEKSRPWLGLNAKTERTGNILGHCEDSDQDNVFAQRVSLQLQAVNPWNS